MQVDQRIDAAKRSGRFNRAFERVPIFFSLERSGLDGKLLLSCVEQIIEILAFQVLPDQVSKSDEPRDHLLPDQLTKRLRRRASDLGKLVPKLSAALLQIVD